MGVLVYTRIVIAGVVAVFIDFRLKPLLIYWSLFIFI